MKKFLSTPEAYVKESLLGLEKAHNHLISYHSDPPVIYRKNFPNKNKVALISGGGSGHEPMHTGFVGHGMLDGACPGEIFTSPTPNQILKAIKLLNSEKGTLLIIKNYTGDLMNFQIAMEIAYSEGYQVDSVLIDDDVAVQNSLYTTGRRGTGTTVLLEKICGAAAEQGASLKEIKTLAQKTSLNGRSMGIALTPCTTPEKGSPGFELNENQIEIGIGIHGEPGRKQIPFTHVDQIAKQLVEAIVNDPNYTRNHFLWKENQWHDTPVTSPKLNKKDRVILFVNGLGSTPESELYILYQKVEKQCTTLGIQISRSLVGSYMTSLDMSGATITLLKVDDEMLDLWDAPVITPALKWN